MDSRERNPDTNRKNPTIHHVAFLAKKIYAPICVVLGSNKVQVHPCFDLFFLFSFAHSVFDGCTHKTHE